MKKPIILHYLFLLALMIGCWRSASAQTQPNPQPLYYTGIVGDDEPFGRRVLLRWFTLEQLIPLDSAVIFRTGNDGVRTKVAAVRRTRSINAIKGIFHRPGEERILNDAREILMRIYGTAGNSPEEFSQYVIDLLEGQDVTEYATTRRNFLIQTNYGFSIVEGYGFVDFVDANNGPYDYELWQGDNTGDALVELGRITLDPTNQMVLPAPGELKEVFLLGRDGKTPARANHRRIFLDWEVSPELFEHRDINFGFDILKLDRALEPGEDYESVKHLVTKVNEYPILPPSPITGEEADQSYLFADDGAWLDTQNEDDLLPVDDTYTYWAVARDLLGGVGEPSNALEATVRDTFEPDFPRGMNIVPARDENDAPLLRVFFNRQNVDTVAYRLYRYQSYVNQGKVGPFPDFNGLTEGFIAEIPQPGDINEDRIVFDDYEPGTTEPGRVFWYCVGAIDAHGNLSALSPPARGVIDDVLPPTLEGILEICVAQPVLSISSSVSLEADDNQSSWQPLFMIEKQVPYYTLLRIKRKSGSATGATDDELLAEISLTQGGRQFFSPEVDETLTGRGDLPTYEFEAVAFDGTTTTATTAPPNWTPNDPRARYLIELGGRGFTEDCIPAAIVNDPIQVEVVPGGEIPPVKFKAPCPGESETLRLYRSVDGGRSYTFVKDFGCGENASIDLIDDFHPESLVQVKYSIAPVDKHGNIGLPFRIPSEYIYLGDVPRPTLTDVVASGSNIPSQRSVTVKWRGPKQGISHYTVRIQKKGNINDIATPVLPLEFSLSDVNTVDAPGDFSFDEGTGEYSINVTKIDRDSTTIDPNVEYTVSVSAAPKAGNSAASTNNMPLMWGADALGFNGGTPGQLRWAARPLPEIVKADDDINTIISDLNVRGGSVLISVLVESLEFGNTELIEPPLMVWRRRADLPNQPWSAVTPVLEAIRRTGNVVDDPFFHKSGSNVFVVDNSGHVPFRLYEYIVLDLNKHTYEIDRVFGPYQIEVDIIPQ